MLAVVPLLGVRALLPQPPNEFRYDRSNNFGLVAIVFAIVGALEGAVVAFFLMGRISWLAWLDAAATAYAVLWLIGLGLGPRVYPHRLLADALQIRLGVLYRATVPFAAIVSAEQKSAVTGWRTECAIEGASAYFRVDGRTDVVLALSAPCQVDRLIRASALVDTFYLAVDDVAGFLRTLDERLGQARLDESTASL
jgi:hypothetical protein